MSGVYVKVIIEGGGLGNALGCRKASLASSASRPWTGGVGAVRASV